MGEQRARAANMAKLEVSRTELCYVTGVYKPTRTFFAQFCKFTNEELMQFNANINRHCQSVAAAAAAKDNKAADGPQQQQQAGPKFGDQVRTGDTVCALYDRDQTYYRALVLSRDKKRQSGCVFFADYGNVEQVPFKQLLEVPAAELPIIERAPFGVSCFLAGCEQFSARELEHMYDCLLQNYVMIKFVEQMTPLQWRVEIPKHAYNIPYWMLFNPVAIGQPAPRAARARQPAGEAYSAGRAAPESAGAGSTTDLGPSHAGRALPAATS